MERIIHSPIISAHESEGLMCRSTLDLLLRTSNDNIMALLLKNCFSLHCLLLDFSKAFDYVPRRLWLKMDAVGIRGGFLMCQVQQVVINGSYSSWMPVRSGIPQTDCDLLQSDL